MLFRLSTRSEAMLVFAISAVLGALAVNRYLPSALNADTILFSIMSLQNVTPFYWGQNRLANIVPFLLSPVQSPLLNLGLQILVIAMAYYAFLIVLTLVVTKHVLGVTDARDRWLGVGIVIATCTLLIAPHAAAIFITEGQPYALSYLTMLAAIFLAQGQHKVRAAASQLAILVSVGLNPSVILFLGPLACLFCFQRRYREGMLLLAGMVAVLRFLACPVENSTWLGDWIRRFSTRLTTSRSDAIRELDPVGLHNFDLDRIYVAGVRRYLDQQKSQPIRHMAIVFTACCLDGTRLVGVVWRQFVGHSEYQPFQVFLSNHPGNLPAIGTFTLFASSANVACNKTHSFSRVLLDTGLCARSEAHSPE